MRYQEVINEGSKILKLNNIKSYNLDSEILLSSALKLDRSQLLLNLNKIIKNQEKEIFFNFINRRIRNEPVAYITGFKEFWKNKFKVNKNVLIPRPETELIIEVVKKTGTYDSCLDVGTGPGNIAITLVKEKLVKKVDAIDISKDALKVAHKNCKKHQINNICFYNVDFFNFTLNTKYDLVVSNPPYISLEDYVTLDRQIKFYEPKIALTDGEEGLSFYRFFAKKLKQILKPKGQLVFEIGLENTQETINDLFIKEGYKCNWEKDLNGDYRVCRVYK